MKLQQMTFGGARFYIGIDRKYHHINFYTSNDITNPVKVVDCTKKDEPLYSMPNVPMAIFGRVVMRALKVLDLDKFPACISHEA
jgi:hypothetical protein